MFGIFQADLPIGRVLWLVALTLISTSLMSHVPLKVPSEPTALAVAMVVYAAHSVVVGLIISLVPSLIIYLVDVGRRLRRAPTWETSALLFEDYRYSRVREILPIVGVVCAAALAAPRFGQPSLILTGLIGIAFILIGSVLGPEELFSKHRWPLVQLRATSETKSSARLFLSGRPFTEISLDADFAGALPHMLAANWEIASDIGMASGDTAWLRKDIPPTRLRFMAEIIEGRIPPSDLFAEIRLFGARVAIVLWFLGGILSVIGTVFTLYVTYGRETEDPFLVMISLGSRGISAAATTFGGMLISFSALAFIRWLEDRSMLTGKPKRQRKKRVGAEPT